MSRGEWKLTDEEYEFIKGEVINVFVTYKVKCVPVSGFEIASKMEVTMIPYTSLKKSKLGIAKETSEDGFFVELNGKEYILYNNELSYERQNWTILHEIGHIALDHRGVSDKEEYEADFFAKFAIAPPVLIHELQLNSAEDIYEYFDISREAAEYAFKYYCKWLRRYQIDQRYKDYEIELLSLYHKQYESQNLSKEVVIYGK